MLKICKKISKKSGKPYIGLFATIGERDILLTADQLVLCELLGVTPSALNNIGDKIYMFKRG
jgi:hypothetical protein